MKLRRHKLMRSASHMAAFIFSMLILALGSGQAAAQDGPYLESAEISRWIEERVRRARLGQPELVRFPLVRRSDGWGCICPEYYVGLSTANAGPGLWIEPRFARTNLRFPKNTIVLAEGYFTGRRRVRDLRSTPDQPEEWIYKPLEFRVTRVTLLPEDHDFYDENSPKNRAVMLNNSVKSRRKKRR